MTGRDFSFVARDLADNRIDLPAPLEFELVSSYDSPANSCEAVFYCDRAWPELWRMEVWLGRDNLYYGGVDERTVTLGEDGPRLRLLSRGPGAALLDNEALPQTYTDVTLEEMFRNHIAPYGFSTLTTDVGEDAILNAYQIVKGTSEWEAFANFFRTTGLGSAYLDDSGAVVCLNDEPYGRTHLFDNRSPEALHFSELKLTDNRYSPVTRFVIRDRDGVYSYAYDNPESGRLRLQRKRYLIPSPAFEASATGGRIDASLCVMRSMLGKRVVTLTAPGLLEIKRRDLVDLRTGWEEYTGLFVHQVRHRVSPGGESTVLVLLDKRYV